jgi:MFS family permease
VTPETVSTALGAEAFQPRSRDLKLYLSVRFATSFGTQIQSVAVGLQVYDLTRDPVALGYVGLAIFLPMFLLVLPAGDMADRVDRRLMLIASYLVQILASFLLLALTLMGVTEIWTYYAAIVFLGVALGISQPAVQSFLPFLVSLERLPQAIAWNSTAYRTATIAGPAVGGVLYELGPHVNYILCLVLYIYTVIAMWNLRIRPREGSSAGSTAFVRIAEGISYIRKRPIIFGAISLDLFAMFLGGATALLPIYAQDILDVGPIGLGFLRTAPSAGAAIVAVVLARHQLQRHAGVWMFACVGLFGAATVVFGLSESYYLSLLALFVVGGADMVSVYVRSAMIQLATPDHMRGRVGSLNSLFVGASNELGEFRAGMTAGAVGTVPAVVIGGVGAVVVVGLWMRLFPELRQVDRFSDVTVQ